MILLSFFLFGTRTWNPTQSLNAPTASFEIGGRCKRPRVYVAVLSAGVTKHRLDRMFRTIMNHSLFQKGCFVTEVIVPRALPISDPKLPIVITNCSWTWQEGLCCRIRVGMDDFLSRDIEWFVRAIDDSWFNPRTLERYIDELESLFDPRRHVIIKAHLSIWHSQHWGVDVLQGGAPILMSRGAVTLLHEYFPRVCWIGPWLSDDNAFTFIVERVFSSPQNWGDIRFSGSPLGAELTDGKFESDWDQHRDTNFRSFNRMCQTSTTGLKPWATMIGAHTSGGARQWQEAIESADSDLIPENLMIGWNGDGYFFCLAPIEVKRNLTSLQSIADHTPRISLGDPILNFSIRDLTELAMRECPRWGRADCRALRKRCRALAARG
jgi:hypothetical protein